MEGRIDEGEITGTIDAISLENIVKITEQMKTSIFKLIYFLKLNKLIFVKYMQVIKKEQDSFVKFNMKVRIFLS